MQLQILDANTLLAVAPFVSLEQELIEFAYDFNSDLISLTKNSIIGLIPLPVHNKLVLVCQNGTCLVLASQNNYKMCTVINISTEIQLRDCFSLNSKLCTIVSRTINNTLFFFQFSEEMLTVRKKEVCEVQFDVTRDNF